LLRISVGVVVERRAAKSPWLDFLWRPISVLVGTPSAVPWTRIGAAGESTMFFAGTAAIELHRSETANYRDNLASNAPVLWVVLRRTAAEQGHEIVTVTADPAEGEAFTDSGDDLVETVPMPPAVATQIDEFVAEHHVERAFVKRRRTRNAEEALAVPPDAERDR
jgi:hypothetical protein